MAGDSLCEIETDKAVMSLDSNHDAILAKILVYRCFSVGNSAIIMNNHASLVGSRGCEGHQTGNRDSIDGGGRGGPISS